MIQTSDTSKLYHATSSSPRPAADTASDAAPRTVSGAAGRYVRTPTTAAGVPTIRI